MPNNATPASKPAQAAEQHGIERMSRQAKRGFVLRLRRWVAGRCLSWSARYKPPVPDYERLALSLQQLHCLAFVGLLLTKAAALELLPGAEYLLAVRQGLPG